MPGVQELEDRDKALEQRAGGEAARCLPRGTDPDLWCGLCSSPGVDDAESECGLDQGVAFDWVITNDGDELSLDGQLEALLQSVRSRL